ncbi:MAG TPA: hypothetical protein VGG75_20230 [Trebonia sp.]
MASAAVDSSYTDPADVASGVAVPGSSISAFNSGNGTSYTSFSQVPAATPGQALANVYQAFRVWSVQTVYGELASQVRAITSNTPLYFYFGGHVGNGVTYANIPDMFFALAKQYTVTVIEDAAQSPGLAPLFGGLGRAYGVQVAMEWTAPSDSTQLAAQAAQWIDNYGMALPNGGGEDFSIRDGTEKDVVGFPVYTGWLPNIKSSRTSRAPAVQGGPAGQRHRREPDRLPERGRHLADDRLAAVAVRARVREPGQQRCDPGGGGRLLGRDQRPAHDREHHLRHALRRLDHLQPERARPRVGQLPRGQRQRDSRLAGSRGERRHLHRGGHPGRVVGRVERGGRASNTSGSAADEAVMQGDGNFVLYTSAGTAVWSSGTAGNDGADLVVQNDGNVVIYSSSGTTLWDTGTDGD